MNEKDKLMIQRMQVENALNLERRKLEILGTNNQEKIDRLLDKWNLIQEKIEKLNKK